MKIPWKLKSSCFRVIDVGHLDRLLYLLQRYVTRRSQIPSVEIEGVWRRHREILEARDATDFVFEFGAGKSLIQNLYLSTAIRQQLVVDISQMLDIDLVEKSRRALTRIVDLRSRDAIKTLRDLDHYGITYLAPFDASNTSLPDHSIDACVSTNTLEHIPPAVIEKIFWELRRIIKPGGVVSAGIDYSDHYSHTDPSIGALNFLSYSDKEWAKYNHNCHYQNRLRHRDYCEMFSHCGFEVEVVDLVYSARTIPEHIDKRFQSQDETWQATSAHFLLTKPL